MPRCSRDGATESARWESLPESALQELRCSTTQQPVTATQRVSGRGRRRESRGRRSRKCELSSACLVASCFFITHLFQLPFSATFEWCLPAFPSLLSHPSSSHQPSVNGASVAASARVQQVTSNGATHPHSTS